MIPNKKPVIGIFDLDGTLGWKTPTYPDVTASNADFLRHFTSQKNAQAILATGRPRTQARVGLSKGGIEPRELYEIFSGGIFEDGWYVEDGDGKIFNGRDGASSQFLELISAVDGQIAKDFLQRHGMAMFPGHVVRQTTTGYELLDYDEKKIGNIDPSLTERVDAVLYTQGNDVRATWKAAIGYMHDVVEAQRPLFQRLHPLMIELMSTIVENPEQYAKVQLWDDAVEVYPIAEDAGHFKKGEGVEMILQRIDPDREAHLVFCCDGKNDLALVDHLGTTYGNSHLVIAPRNASSVLKQKIRDHNKEYGEVGFVLDEDCTRFGVGATRLLNERGLLD